MKRLTAISFLYVAGSHALSPPIQEVNNSQFNPPSLSLFSTSSNEFVHKPRNTKIFSVPNQNFARLGDGYRTMATEFTPNTLLLYPQSSLVPSHSSYSVSFLDDQTDAQLKAEMSLNVSGTVPVEDVATVTGAYEYVLKAKKTRLSQTSTLIANAKLGTYKLVGAGGQAFIVTDAALHLFDENGVLRSDSFGNFYKLYGDSLVVSENLVGKLFVTIKLNFDSNEVMAKFTQEVGASVSSLVTSGGKKGKTQRISVRSVAEPQDVIKFSSKLNALAENVKRHISLTIVATQFGGVPQYLSELFDTPSTCSLADLRPCQAMVNKLNKYVSQSFKEQLNPNDPATWYAESLMVAPYDTLNLISVTGQPLYFQNSLNPLENIYLTDLVDKVTRAILGQVKNHNIALNMLKVHNLARNEVAHAENVLAVSENNYKKLKGFAVYCYTDLPNCYQNQKNAAFLNSLVAIYPTDLLNSDVGNFVVAVASRNQPLSGQKARSSENFIKPKALLESGRYSSFYFKMKDPNNDLVKNSNVKFSVTCDIPWYRGYDQDVLLGVHSGTTVLNNTLSEIYNRLCGSADSLYIRNPSGFSWPNATIEIWGRE